MHLKCENSFSLIICGGRGFESGIETKLSSGLFGGSDFFTAFSQKG